MRSRAVSRALAMLVFDGLGAAALADLFPFIAHLRHEIGQKTHVGFEPCRGGIDFRRQDVGRLGGAWGASLRSAMGIKKRSDCLRYTTPAGARNARSSSWPSNEVAPPSSAFNQSLILRTASATGSSTTASTSPMSNARCALIFSAATNISRAMPLPTSRGNRCVPPHPVINPKAAPRCPKTA